MNMQPLATQDIQTKNDALTKFSDTFSKYLSKDVIALIVIVCASFVLDIYSLTRYALAYGVDGAFYNIQVRQVLTYGIPNSGDPPIVYYLMAFFAMLFGISLGIKVTMAVFSSLIAVPAYLIIKMYTDTFEKKTAIPALLSAFLIVFNVYYLRLMEEFKQNLIGVFFLLFFIYFLLTWISSDELRLDKQLVLTITFFVLTILTHIYTAGITIVILVSVFLFKLVLDYKINRKFPLKEFKIVIGSSIIAIIALIFSFMLYPSMIADFLKFKSFFVSFLVQNSGQFDAIMFVTIPFVGGLLFILKTSTFNNIKRLYISFTLIVFSLLLFCLSLPFISSTWETRFMLLNFIPIALVSSLAIYALYYIDFSKFLKVNKKVNIKKIAVYSLCIIFVATSLISMSNFVPTMGPTITQSNYQELQNIKTQYYGTNNTIKPGDIIIISAGNIGDNYWFSYVFGQNTVVGLNKIGDLNSTTTTNYFLFTIVSSNSPYNPPQLQTWNILLPIGFFTNTGTSRLASPTNQNNPINQNGPLSQNGPATKNPSQQQPNSPQNPTGTTANQVLSKYNNTTIFTGSFYDVYQLS